MVYAYTIVTAVATTATAAAATISSSLSSNAKNIHIFLLFLFIFFFGCSVRCSTYQAHGSQLLNNWNDQNHKVESMKRNRECARRTHLQWTRHSFMAQFSSHFYHHSCALVAYVCCVCTHNAVWPMHLWCTQIGFLFLQFYGGFWRFIHQCLSLSSFEFSQLKAKSGKSISSIVL